MSQSRAERMRDNFLRQGGRAKGRNIPEPLVKHEPMGGPGKKAEELIISIPVDEMLPDRYQGRLRWPIELSAIERLYRGEWDAQDLLDYVAQQRDTENNPALNDAWNNAVELAHSILSEGQVVPVTVTPARDLPVGYRFVLETGEGRYWAYQVMRWLLNNAPEELDVPIEAWQEDPAFIRAVAISEPSRLRQVAENEQRQSYASAVDRAVAYASMLAEDANYPITGSPPGIRNGALELPDAYWRAASRGLRGRKQVVQQVPTGKRQIQRHLKLLTDLDPHVLALAKQNALSEAQLRPLIGKALDEQRTMVRVIIEKELSSREAAAMRDRLEEDGQLSAEEVAFALRQEQEAIPVEKERRQELTLPEEASRFLRTLTRAASRYETLRQKLSDKQLLDLLETELRSYDESARGARRSVTPRRRIQRLRALLEQIEEA
ncbi:MAG: ParB N-terminal domain-containing protein [Chloroflexota bacterium]|nr:ParB N-terminal domain-containing protein [Chloroflexota bacterium]